MQLIIRDGGQHSARQLAESMAIPTATFYRLLASLKDQGLIQSLHKGHYIAGPQLLSLRPYLNQIQLASKLARPPLEKLARKYRTVAHMGMLYDDMVTYLVKAGESHGEDFTSEGIQLEAYCSGIGKILLANLPEEEQAQYLAGGPFVALTAHTKTDAGALSEDLNAAKNLGYAIDDREFSPDLRCLAVPVPSKHTPISLGISISRQGAQINQKDDPEMIADLQKTAGEISEIISDKLAI